MANHLGQCFGADRMEKFLARFDQRDRNLLGQGKHQGRTEMVPIGRYTWNFDLIRLEGAYRPVPRFKLVVPWAQSKLVDQILLFNWFCVIFQLVCLYPGKGALAGWMSVKNSIWNLVHFVVVVVRVHSEWMCLLSQFAQCPVQHTCLNAMVCQECNGHLTLSQGPLEWAGQGNIGQTNFAFVQLVHTITSEQTKQATKKASKQRKGRWAMDGQ